MKFAHVKYDKKSRIVNKETNEEMRIVDVSYDRNILAVVYTVTHIRYKFDMRKIPECVIDKNVEKGTMEVSEI